MAVKFLFDADAAAFPSGSFPELKQAISGSMQRRVLAFDDTDVERCLFEGFAASGWSGSITASVVSFADSGTTASVVWELSVDAVSVGESMGGSTFATTSSGIAGTAAGGSALQTTELSPDDDAAATGDHLTFLLRRVTTHGSDTMTGDMFFSKLIIADGS